MSVCENCGYVVQYGQKHENEGDGICRRIEIDTEKVLGWARRRYPNLYVKKK